jgi:hypothetical protein
MRGHPARKEFVANPQSIREVEEDVKIGSRLAGRWHGRVDFRDATLRVCVGSFLFAPDGGRKHEMCEFTCGDGVKAVLNDEELYAAKSVL